MSHPMMSPELTLAPTLICVKGVKIEYRDRKPGKARQMSINCHQ